MLTILELQRYLPGCALRVSKLPIGNSKSKEEGCDAWRRALKQLAGCENNAWQLLHQALPTALLILFTAPIICLNYHANEFEYPH